MNNISEQVKIAGDLISVTTIGATLMQWLPPVAAILTIIWTGIRIYETKTVQRLIGKDDDIT